MKGRHSRVAVALGACVSMLGATAIADELPYTLRYEAPPGCASEERFLGEVVKRTTDPKAATGAHFEVRISAEPEAGFRGEIVVTDGQGNTGHKTIDETSCAGVAAGLAFAMALAVDLGGHIDEAAEPPEAAPAPPPPTPAPPPPASSVPRSSATRASPRAASVELVLFAGAGPRGGLGDGVQGSGEVGVAVGRRGTGLWAPQGRLSWVAAQGDVEREVGGAELTLLAARLAVCPVELSTGALGLRPCLALEAGAVLARGVGVPEPRSERVRYSSLEATLHLRWNVTEAFFVELGGGPTFPLERTQFAFQPRTVLYTLPDVSARGALLLGIRFLP